MCTSRIENDFEKYRNFYSMNNINSKSMTDWLNSERYRTPNLTEISGERSTDVKGELEPKKISSKMSSTFQPICGLGFSIAAAATLVVALVAALAASVLT